jgi:hypothetical protein
LERLRHIHIQGSNSVWGALKLRWNEALRFVYWRICLSFAHRTRAYRSLFTGLRLDIPMPYMPLQETSQKRFVHAEIQIIVYILRPQNPQLAKAYGVPHANLAPMKVVYCPVADFCAAQNSGKRHPNNRRSRSRPWQSYCRPSSLIQELGSMRFCYRLLRLFTTMQAGQQKKN